jgi:KUP system potassium uptake protein
MQAAPAAADVVSLAARREPHANKGAMLALGALGVVYGDLGTNPLFAMRECFKSQHPLAFNETNVLGSVSLAIWALILVICVKYTMFVLRADNEGEGGALALLGKVPPKVRDGIPYRPIILVVVLLFGSSLLLGDGVVTPAISVLSAVEGLKDLGVPQERVVMYTVIILAGLFLIQRFGTHRVGSMFGPVMVLWFLAIGAMGAGQIVREPGVLRALDPRYAIALLTSGASGSYLVLGAIILCVGGGEALYADLGHFGRRPIIQAFYFLVLPALVLTYVGQGALLLRVGESATENPFYGMCPDILRIPLVILATAATVIASQAMISGAFSLARQGVNLGFLPRVTIKHTSTQESGQIYVPIANTILMVGCMTLVIAFGSSDKLAAAYGLSTNGTMTATTIGFFFVMWRVWKVNIGLSLLVAGTFLAIDGSFLGANITKIPEGGWIPLSVGGGMFALAMTWRWGRRRLRVMLMRRAQPVEEFLARPDVAAATRTTGTSVYLTSATDGVPPILIHHFERNGTIREQIVLLTIETLDIPFVEPKRRLQEKELGGGFFRVVARFGYAESPNVPAILEACAIMGLAVDFDTITYVLGHDNLRLKYEHGPLSAPRRVFQFLSKNQASTLSYFSMPVDRVIEIGMQLEL